MAASNETLDGPRSQASAAYLAIRRDILAGRHLPDQKLKVQELVAELGVSPGAVREALSRLVPEQLVVSRDQRGFVVAPLSLPDLEELTDLRCEIEALALRRSVARGDLAWEAAILSAAHRLRGIDSTLSKNVLNPAWAALHADFHTALVSACGSRRLLLLHGQLYEQAERYRGLSLHVTSGRNVAREHHDIVDMAIARDAEGLVTLVTEHIRKTSELIVQIVRTAQG